MAIRTHNRCHTRPEKPKESDQISHLSALALLRTTIIKMVGGIISQLARGLAAGPPNEAPIKPFWASKWDRFMF